MGSSNVKMANYYSGILAVPVEVGQVFAISGETARNCNRMLINLSHSNGRDVMLHLSIRFPENVIVRNVKNNGIYGVEEKNSGGTKGQIRNPFIAGKAFQVYIQTGIDRFIIALNDGFYCDFIYRIPLNQINQIEISDASVVRQVDHRQVFPFPHPILQRRKLPDSFSHDLPMAPSAGLVIVMKATATGNGQGSFTVRFTVGNSGQQALHFDARFSQNVIVRNHTCNDQRIFNPKDEERHGQFPFRLNQQFKIAFGFGLTGFRIAIDGRLFCEFKYRTTVDKLSGIKCTENQGLILNILELNHVRLDQQLTNIEAQSRP